MEPVCAEVFPGNSIDASSYSAFIRDNDIRKGIIVADKGFPPSKLKEELAERPELHFLTPIKRNNLRISDNDMLAFEGVLEGIEGHVVYKKKQIKGERRVIRILILKPHTSVTMTDGCLNLYLTDTKVMTALTRQMSRVISLLSGQNS